MYTPSKPISRRTILLSILPIISLLPGCSSLAGVFSDPPKLGTVQINNRDPEPGIVELIIEIDEEVIYDAGFELPEEDSGKSMLFFDRRRWEDESGAFRVKARADTGDWVTFEPDGGGDYYSPTLDRVDQGELQILHSATSPHGTDFENETGEFEERISEYKRVYDNR